VFIFIKKGGSVVDGKIAEFLGLNYPLKNKMNDIIANYKNSSVLDLTGAIFEYDLNYFRLSSEVIKQGKRTGVTASLHNLPIAETNVSGKVAMGYYDTGAPDANGCQKLWYCEGYSNGDGYGITCYNQGYLNSNCNAGELPPNTGSDSSYDSSGSQMGGGSPYGGNSAPPYTAPSTNEEFTKRIDSVNLSPCFKKVLRGLEISANNCVANTITTFSGETPGFNWAVADATTVGSNGVTSPSYNTVTKSVYTTFNSSNITSGSDLAAAKTLIHESIHAYLVAYFHTNPAAANYEYAKLVEDWATSKNPNLDEIHHNEMVRSKIGEIATTLKLYGQSQGYNIPYQYYSDLAWGGLTNTKAFKALSTTDQNRIIDVILTEQSGTNGAGNPSSFKGRPSGC
jgi:hypothetical protein